MQRKTEGAGRVTSSILKLEPKDEVSKREGRAARRAALLPKKATTAIRGFLVNN